MQYLIDIRTTSGIRLDVLENSTIEFNMGGITLLDMSHRTTTYTNQFNLPRTPTNDDVFGFSAVTQSLVKPVVNVYITKGLLQMQGTIKVTEFDTTYKCVFSQADPVYVQSLKSTFVESLLDGSIGPFASASDFIASICGTSNDYRVLFGDTSNIIASNADDSKNVCVKLSALISGIETACGVRFEGNLLTETLFTQSYLNISSAYFIDIAGNYSVLIPESTISASDLVAEIAKYFLKSIEFTGNVINFVDILTATPVQIDTLSIESKEMYTGLASTNKVNYTVNSLYTDLNYLGANIISEGTGTKDILKLNAYLPYYNGSRYVLATDTQSINKIIICQASNLVGNHNVTYKTTTATISTPAIMTFADLSTIFESVLQPVFTSTFILNAEGWMSAFDANAILTNRNILCPALGGRYWVETMAYDMVSGRCKLKLIRL